MIRNNNATTCTEANEELVFIVDEEVIIVMDSIIEEHECKSKACNVVTESGYNGIEPHEQPSSIEPHEQPSSTTE